MYIAHGHTRAFAQCIACDMQVSDAALASLMAMGYTRQLAARALRFCGGDVARATDFCLEHQNDRAQRRGRDARARQLTDQQRELGKALNGEWVDVGAVQQLEELGYPVMLVAEALRCAALNCAAY